MQIFDGGPFDKVAANHRFVGHHLLQTFEGLEPVESASQLAARGGKSPVEPGNEFFGGFEPDGDADEVA